MHHENTPVRPSFMLQVIQSVSKMAITKIMIITNFGGIWSSGRKESWEGLQMVIIQFRGVARIIQRGGYTVSKWGYSPDCHYGQDIVMAFSLPVVGCLVKKRLAKGGVTDPLGYALGLECFITVWYTRDRTGSGAWAFNPYNFLAD